MLGPLGYKINLAPDQSGHDLYRVDLWATAIFVVFAWVTVAVPDKAEIPFAVACSVAFVAGVVAFLWAFGVSVERSRQEEVNLAGVFAMSGTTPGAVRRRFHALTAVQTVVAVVTSSMRPYTPQAFGILVPMLGFGIAGLWAAHHGDFPERRRTRGGAMTVEADSTPSTDREVGS